MRLEVFSGGELREVMDEVSCSMGEDAMMLQSRVVRRGQSSMHEIVAAPAASVESFLEQVGSSPELGLERRSAGARPFVLALVGPAGAGKTSAAIRLALHPLGLAGHRIGLVTLDTHRPGALEEMQMYAEIARLPLEIAYGPGEVEGIRARMRDHTVLIVDTPGREFGANGSDGWLETLHRFGPDEVHLVIPAGLRSEVAARARERFAPCKVTHALYSRMDDVSEGEAMIALAEHVALPARWVTEGPEIPGQLAHAASRLLSWGAPAGASPVRRAV